MKDYFFLGSLKNLLLRKFTLKNATQYSAVVISMALLAKGASASIKDKAGKSGKECIGEVLGYDEAEKLFEFVGDKLARPGGCGFM